MIVVYNHEFKSGECTFYRISNGKEEPILELEGISQQVADTIEATLRVECSNIITDTRNEVMDDVRQEIWFRFKDFSGMLSIAAHQQGYKWISVWGFLDRCRELCEDMKKMEIKR